MKKLMQQAEGLYGEDDEEEEDWRGKAKTVQKKSGKKKHRKKGLTEINEVKES